MPRQFSLRTILLIIGLVALFLALRRSYVLTTDGLQVTIYRAWQMPSLFAGLAVAASLIGSKHSHFVRSLILGAATATAVASWLAVEIAEGLRSMRYWDWSNDWPEFIVIVGSNTSLGCCVGIGVAVLHAGCIGFFSPKNTS